MPCFFFDTFKDEELTRELKIAFETNFLEFKLEIVAELKLEFLLELETCIGLRELLLIFLC